MEQKLNIPKINKSDLSELNEGYKSTKKDRKRVKHFIKMTIAILIGLGLGIGYVVWKENAIALHDERQYERGYHEGHREGMTEAMDTIMCWLEAADKSDTTVTDLNLIKGRDTVSYYMYAR